MTSLGTYENGPKTTCTGNLHPYVTSVDKVQKYRFKSTLLNISIDGENPVAIFLSATSLY